MGRTTMIGAALAAMAATAAVAPAEAGERYGAVVVVHGERTAPWYRQPPWIGTGVGYYYSHHPRDLPGYPHRLAGYPVPIHRLPDTDVRVRVFRGLPAPHVDWCLTRYRSYDPATDTFKPYHGPRRLCLSPYR